MTLTRILAERFCAAPVPLTECADPCASMQEYPNRTGTNFLSVEGARAVLEHALTQDIRLDFEAWAGPQGFCLELLFGAPSNPYEDENTHLAYRIWCASRGITV